MATELITNGAFAGSFGQNPTGWTGTGGRIETLGGADGSSFYGLGGGVASHGGTVQQTMATVVGKTYTVTFKSGISWQDGNAKVDGRLKVEALSGATLVEAQNIDLAFNKAAGWQTYTFTFTATSSQTTLKFTDSTPSTQPDFDIGLDAVSVQEAQSYKSVGEWGDLKPWPFVAIHAVVLPNGKVLTYGSGADADPYNTLPKNAVMLHDIYDPLTGTHQTIDHHHTTTTDIFCSSAIIIPGTDQVMIVGGDTRPTTSTGYNRGVDDTNIYDVSTGVLNQSPDGDMNYARWYATTIGLPTGQVLTMGGIDQNGATVRTPEIWTQGEGWRALTGATTADLDYYYPRMWPGKDGKIVYVSVNGGNNGVAEVMQLDPHGNGSLTKLGQLPFSHDGNSPAIMYESGKVLFMASDGQLWTMDINGSAPVFVQSAKLSQNRDDANMTVLADGSVLINGGTTGGSSLSATDKTATIWNPSTGQLSYLADELQARVYHATSVLLQDGTILSMGGGFASSAQNDFLDSQIYKPTYLFDANGNPATRPVITHGVETVAPGQTFSVMVDNAAAITKMTFVKTGATTHAFNMDANFINLTFTKGADNHIIVSLPAGVDKVPAGSWMLFAWNDKGVPSIADMVDVKPTLTPFEADGSGGVPIVDDGGDTYGANILVNGNVEQLVQPDGWKSHANADFPGWKNSGGTTIEVFRSNGNQVMDLDSTTSVDTIYQDVATVAGKTYKLTFNAFGVANTSDVEVVWNGQVVGTVKPGTASQSYTFEVLGTGGTVRLMFREPAGQNSNDGARLDNISLRMKSGPVGPEPELPDPGSLLTKGSFENVPGAHAGMPMEIILTNGQAGPWQSSTNRIEVWTEGKNGVTGTDGKNVAEVNAQNGVLSQSVKTEAGKYYGISFDYAGQPGAIASSKMEVLWNGVVIGTIEPTDAMMKNYHLHVHGTGGNDIIGFRSVAGDTDNVGGLLDKVLLYVSTHGEPSVTNPINGTSGDDYLVDTDANDVIKAGDGRDTIFLGGKGDDTVDGEGGSYNQVDLRGSASDYTFTRNADGTIKVVSAATGTDTLKNIQGFWFYGEGKWYDAAQLAPTSGGPVDPGTPGGPQPGTPNTITGTSGGDYIVDTDANDTIKAGDGRDTIFLGGKGDDIVDGEGGDYNQVDLNGRASDYTFTRNADGTITVASALYGTDILKNIQGLWFYGEGKWYAANDLAKVAAGGDGITVNAGPDGGYFTGTDGNDRFNGSTGDDVFTGGKGDDVYYGGGGSYNQVNLHGALTDWDFSRNADGSVTASHATYGTDTLHDIGALWFEDAHEWRPVDAMVG